MENDDLDITLPEESDEPAEEVEEESEEEQETEESEEEEEDSESEEEEEKEKKVGEEEEEEDEDKEKDKKEEKDEKKQFRHSRPSYREIKDKFPEFFKTFPDLRDAFFREKEYSKVFPTVDDAKEALAYAQSFGEISGELMQGNPEGLFSQLAEANPQAFRKVAENILPVIHRVDKDTFFAITTPLLERFVKSMDEEGIRTNDTNLRKAALLVGRFMTGELKIPDSSSKRERVDPDRTKFEQERSEFYNKRFQTAQADVYSNAESSLNEEIDKVLEDEELSDFMRQKLREEILKEVNKSLTKDERHMALMASLWKKWAKTNYSADSKRRLLDAYLTRAKQLVNPVRDRVMKDAMKRKVKKVNRQEENESEDTGSKKSTGKPLSAKQVDWSRTSDRDFLNDNITLRK